MPRSYSLYKVTYLRKGWFYIGVTDSPHRRKLWHMRQVWNNVLRVFAGEPAKSEMSFHFIVGKEVLRFSRVKVKMRLRHICVEDECQFEVIDIRKTVKAIAKLETDYLTKHMDDPNFLNALYKSGYVERPYKEKRYPYLPEPY